MCFNGFTGLDRGGKKGAGLSIQLKNPDGSKFAKRILVLYNGHQVAQYESELFGNLKSGNEPCYEENEFWQLTQGEDE